MIKTFEQFVSTVYGRPINEAFQSSKLRQIIKQHGKPKHYWDNKILYDLKDEEIVDVIDKKEYLKHNYIDKENEEAIFKIELEDGYYLIISNLGILYTYWDYITDNISKQKEEIFKKRHSERHKGNLGKGGDTIHKKHMEKVNKIESKRLAKKFQEFIPEIVETVQSAIKDFDISGIEEDTHTIYDDYEIEITLDGVEYMIYAKIDIETSETEASGGEYHYDGKYYLEKFEIMSEEGYVVSNIDLGITHDKYENLFKTYEVDLDGGVYDHYELYDVSPSDFA